MKHGHDISQCVHVHCGTNPAQRAFVAIHCSLAYQVMGYKNRNALGTRANLTGTSALACHKPFHPPSLHEASLSVKIWIRQFFGKAPQKYKEETLFSKQYPLSPQPRDFNAKG
jgi:hypothetical protein